MLIGVLRVFLHYKIPNLHVTLRPGFLTTNEILWARTSNKDCQQHRSQLRCGTVVPCSLSTVFCDVALSNAALCFYPGDPVQPLVELPACFITDELLTVAAI